MSVPLIANPERARRLARVLISDIATEYAEQVRIGVEKDDLFERLAPLLQQARVYYRARVAGDVKDRDRMFDFAIVDVLLAQNRAIRRYVW